MIKKTCKNRGFTLAEGLSLPSITILSKIYEYKDQAEGNVPSSGYYWSSPANNTKQTMYRINFSNGVKEYSNVWKTYKYGALCIQK